MKLKPASIVSNYINGGIKGTVSYEILCEGKLAIEKWVESQMRLGKISGYQIIGIINP